MTDTIANNSRVQILNAAAAAAESGTWTSNPDVRAILQEVWSRSGGMDYTDAITDGHGESVAEAFRFAEIHQT